MSSVARVGIDLGTLGFQLYGQDTVGREVLRKKATRQQMMRLLGNLPSCTVVMEACVGSHFLARQRVAFGHEVKLISPQFADVSLIRYELIHSVSHRYPRYERGATVRLDQP